jgi:hypothetical protein
LIASSIDLVVADADLPGFDTLLQDMDDEPRTRSVAVLILGGEGRHRELAHLGRPFREQELREIVHAMVAPARRRVPTLPMAIAPPPAFARRRNTAN